MIYVAAAPVRLVVAAQRDRERAAWRLQGSLGFLAAVGLAHGLVALVYLRSVLRCTV